MIHRNCPDAVIGLDVGTTKICVIVALGRKGGFDVLTMGTSESKGLKKGIVVDVEEASRSIRRALDEAEDKGYIKIDRAFVGIAGGHIKSFNGYGVIRTRERVITEGDVERVIDIASVAYVPVDREVLQIIPSSFSIDGVNGIINPLGRKGQRLEAKVHIVTGAITPVQNLIRCCEAAGVRVADIVLEPIASAVAVLSEEEKATGTLMIDLGGGTTDIAVFREGILRHTASLAIGGNHITNDIASGLGVKIDEAERIKKTYGLTGEGNVEVGGEGIPLRVVTEIIYMRCEELFSLVKKEIINFSGYRNRAGLPSYIKGTVLTGGTSLLKGIDQVAEKVLGTPVRIGIPEIAKENQLKNPIYSTGLGLVRLGLGLEDADKLKNDGLRFDSHLRVFDRMKDWVKGFLK